MDLKVIKGGKKSEEESKQESSSRPIPKCKFCSQPMQYTGKDDIFYCSCKGYNDFLRVEQIAQDAKKKYEEQIAICQKLSQQLIMNSDYWKKVVAVSQNILNLAKEQKQEKVVNLEKILSKEKDKEELLGYYWFPPMS